MEAPIPLDAPVTTATFPLSLGICRSPLSVCGWAGTGGMIDPACLGASTHLYVRTSAAGAGTMRRQAYACGLEAALAVVGGKWKAIILWHLAPGPRRFGELRRQVTGISEKMLIQ